jgi:hypothetical protein
MSKVLYTEQQRFTQVRWIWFLTVPIFLLTLIFMLQAMYQQLVLGQPWGNEPMSDPGLIALTLFVIFCHAVLFWILLSIRLEIEITELEFRYKFFSFLKRWNVLTRSDIATCSFLENTLRNAHGVGYHKNIFTKTVRMNITGEYLLVMNTVHGKTIILSTQNKEEMERAINKLMSKSQNIY